MKGRSMSSLRKGLAGLVAVAAVSLVAAIPASANGTLEAACVFTGHANVFADPVQYVGGGGSFGFDAQHITCAGEHNSAPEVTSSDLGNGTALTANGTYVSLVCGTSNSAVPGGPANGVATLSDSRGTLGQSSFSIPFVGGQGIITGTFAGSGPYAGHNGLTPGFVTIFPNNQATQIIAGGDVNHAEVPGPTGTETCVDNYGVAGVFLIAGV
jgi:hypothetical protein